MPYIYCMYLKSENFGENLKIHAGGDDKLRIQFAPPNAAGTILGSVGLLMISLSIFTFLAFNV